MQGGETKERESDAGLDNRVTILLLAAVQFDLEHLVSESIVKHSAL